MIKPGDIGTYVGSNADWVGVRLKFIRGASTSPTYTGRRYSRIKVEVLDNPRNLSSYFLRKGETAIFLASDIKFNVSGFGRWFKEHS